MQTLVIIPTYNEQGNISRLLEALQVVDCQPEVLVVDDSSPDGTAAIVRRHQADGAGKVHLLERAGKRGLASAYLAGFAWGLQRDYEIFVQMDADFSHPPEVVDSLVTALHDADLVLASRYIDGGGIEGWPAYRRWLSSYGNKYARRMLRLSRNDLTGGFKAWSRSTLEAISFDSIGTEGYGFQIEMTYRAIEAGARVIEVPFTFRDREAGKSKMTFTIGFEALFAVARLRRQQPVPPGWVPSDVVASPPSNAVEPLRGQRQRA